MKKMVICTLALSALVSPLQAAEVNMQPGLWEWSMSVDMPNMPMAMPPTVYRSCVTEDDLIPQQQEDGASDCKQVEHSVSGDSVSWKIECSGPGGGSQSVGSMRYQGSAASGEILTTVQGMAMKSTLSGRRVGACK